MYGRQTCARILRATSNCSKACIAKDDSSDGRARLTSSEDWCIAQRVSCICQLPHRITMTRWLQAMLRAYEAPFLCLITLIYWTQGFRSSEWMAISYETKDKLRLTVASQVLVSTAFLPWSVKPIIGIVSDCVPSRGKKRLSYLIISSVLSFLPWVALAQMAPSRESYVYLAVLLTTQNIGAAMVDVVVEAMVVEVARTTRVESAGDFHPLSWIAMAFGGIIGSLCGGLGLAILNVEGIFLLFSIFPILQLLACGIIDEKTLGQVAMAIDEGGYNVLQNDHGEVISIEVLEEPHIELDYYGMLSSFTEEGVFLDTIMLQAIARDRQKYDGDEVAIRELPWNYDAGQEYSGKVLATQAEVKQHDSQDDEDWIQIGQTGWEKDVVILETTSRDVEGDMHEILISDASDTLEELDLVEVQKLQRHTVRPIEGAHLKLASSGASEGQLNKRRGLWQELKSAVLDVAKQRAILQPILWLIITQLVIPNLSSVIYCYQTDDLQTDHTLVGALPVISWGGLLLSTFLFNHYLKDIPLRRVTFW